MSINAKKRIVFRKLGLFVGFSFAIVLITRIALHLGTIANPTTVGFSFLLLVMLAAIFAGLPVGIATSVVATLNFNYFFFPPVGTFTIADPHNWVALFAFLLTSIIVSRLTASAHENSRKAETLDLTLVRLREFAGWLLSNQPEQVTLSGIAREAVEIFSLEYCSVHVFAEGRWHHFSGTSVGRLNDQIADNLKVTIDHPTGILELAEEQGLGVRYSQIRTGQNSIALLVIKDKNLTEEAVQLMASMIGILLVQILQEKQFPV